MIGYLTNAEKIFLNYKEIGEKAIEQVPDSALFWKPNEESNSIGNIVKHLSGNMLSRWTGFLHADGEKSWRNRDSEFEDTIESRNELMEVWQKGWICLFEALKSLDENQLTEVVFIRKEKLTVIEAINRQLAHYSYHIGQIVYIAKSVAHEKWISLSIPKNESTNFNKAKGL